MCIQVDHRGPTVLCRVSVPWNETHHRGRKENDRAHATLPAKGSWNPIAFIFRWAPARTSTAGPGRLRMNSTTHRIDVNLKWAVSMILISGVGGRGLSGCGGWRSAQRGVTATGEWVSKGSRKDVDGVDDRYRGVHAGIRVRAPRALHRAVRRPPRLADIFLKTDAGQWQALDAVASLDVQAHELGVD